MSGNKKVETWRWTLGEVVLVPVANSMRGKDNEGDWTTLHGAAAKGDLRAVQLLLEVAGDLDAASPGGTTLAHCAAQNGDLELITILIEQKAQVDTGDLAGKSPIQLAAEADHRAVVEALLAAGADPTERDMEGVRAIDIAVGETAALLRRHALTQLAGQGGKDRDPGPQRGPN